MSGFPVVVKPGGAPFKRVASGAAVATVADEGVHITLVDGDAPPLVVEGDEPGPEPGPPLNIEPPAITPSSGTEGDTQFTGDLGIWEGGNAVRIRWLLDDEPIGAGMAIVPDSPGELIFEVTASNNAGTATAVSAPAIVEPEPEPDLFLSADDLDYGTFRIPAGVVAMRAVLRGADGADDGDNRGGQGATLEVLFENLEDNEQYEHWITGIGDEDETSLWATNDPDDTWAAAGAGANADGGPGSGYPAQDNIAYGCTILENTSGVDGGADGVTGSIAVYFIT